MTANEHRCDAEIRDRVAERDLPPGRKAWKGCRRAATVTKRGRVTGALLRYCAAHAEHPDHGAHALPLV